MCTAHTGCTSKMMIFDHKTIEFDHKTLEFDHKTQNLLTKVCAVGVCSEVVQVCEQCVHIGAYVLVLSVYSDI